MGRTLAISGGVSGGHVTRTSAHGVYVFVVDGKLSSNVAELGRRDSFGVSGIEEITIEAADNTDVFFVETVMIDDARITAWEKEHGEDVRH
ncbi:hypothetical protein [Xanthobacter autotrophicus]|uniref:pirin family protein n=1 Tax=Xanthobacter autotrophicus TaxID=280 RepID=UPI00372BFDE2